MTNDPKKNTSDPLDDFFTIEETPKPQSSQGGNPMDDFFSIDDQPITSQIPEMGVSALGKPKKVEDYNVMDHLVNGLVDFGRQLFNPIETEQSKENIGGRKNLARSTDKGFRTFAGSASRGLGEMFRFMTTAPGGMPMVVNPNNEEQLTEAYKKRINNEDLGGQLIGYADKQTEKASDIDTDPDHWTGVLGQVIPFTAGTVATVATSPLPPVSATIGAANLGTLGLSSFGSGIEAYDNYKDSKGLEKDYYERLGIGLLYGTAEFAMEKIQLDKFLPKGATSKMGKMVFGAVPEEQVAKKGADLVQDFIKSSPQRKSLVDNATDIFKQSREGAMFEGGTEALTELSQEFTNWLYYESEDKQINQEFFKQTMNAFVGGALMGGGLGPLSYGSQQVANKQRREQAGQVVIGHNKRTGETLEIVGQKSTGDGGVITYQAMRPNGKFTEVKEDEVENVVQLPYNSFKSILQGKEEGEVFLNQIEQQQLQDQINEQRTAIETEMADKVYTDDLGNRVIAPAKYNGDEVFVVGKDPNNEKLGYIVNSKGERKAIELERLEDAEAIPYEEFVNAQLPAPPQPQGNRPPTVGESFELPEIPERETQAGRYTVTGIDREAGYIYAESVDEDGFIEEIPIDVFEQYRETGEEQQPQAASPANEILGDAQTLRNIFSEQDGKILSDNDKSEADQLPPGSTVNLQVDKPQEQASTRQIKLGKKDITIEETPEQRRVVTETPLTEKEAKSLAKQVSDRYPKVRFEVVDNTPQGDDFAEQDFQLVQKLNRPELNATYKLKGEEVEKAVIEQQLEQGNFDNIEIEGDNKLKNRLNTLKRTSEAPQAREVLNAPTLEQESKLTELIDTYNSGDQSVKNDIDFLAHHLKYGLSSTRGGQLQLIDKKSGQVVARKTVNNKDNYGNTRNESTAVRTDDSEKEKTVESKDGSAVTEKGESDLPKGLEPELQPSESSESKTPNIDSRATNTRRTTGSEGGQTDNIDGTEGGIQSQLPKGSTPKSQPSEQVQEERGVQEQGTRETTQGDVEQVADRARKFITLSKSSYETTGTNPFALIAGIGTRTSELKNLFKEIEEGATTPRAKKVVEQINDYAERGYIDLQHSENVGRMYINERESIPFDTWLENGFVDAVPTQEQTTQIDAVLEQFTQENGELDADAIRKQLTEDEGFFTIFPFSLNTEELNALKQQFNEEQGEKTGDSTEAGEGAESRETKDRSPKSEIEQSKEGVVDSREKVSKKVGQKEEGSQKTEDRSRKTEDGSQKMESEQDSSSSVSEKDSVTLAYGSEAKRKSAVRKTYQETLGKSVENPKDYQEGNGRSQTVREGRETSGINRPTPTIQEILRKVVPRTVLKTFKNSKRKDLTGVKINNSQDVADLFSIHRSPYIEKSQVIILDGDGKVLANFGRTDNLPNQTSTFPASTINSYKTVGAKKVFIMHNHPSGDHTVSRADIINTRAFAEQLDPDISFGGHVVIDTDKYSLIDSAGKVQELDYKEKPNTLFSERAYIKDGNQAAELGAALLKREGMQQAVLYLDTKLGIAAFDVLPTDLTDKQIRDQISKAMDQNIGTNYILIHDGLRKSFMQAPEGIIDLIDIKQGETQKFTIKPRRKSVGQFFENTPEYKKQTETSAFKKWFGDSKVVDENGEPLVVYHGTNADFSEFIQRNSPNGTFLGEGFYFTSDYRLANRYAKKTGGNVMPVYLKAERPESFQNLTKEEKERYLNSENPRKDFNFDSQIIGNLYKVYDPTQIKSATGNRGTFDRNDPDIRHMKWPKSVQASKAEMEKAQKAVDSLSKNWKNAPKIELFENSERIKDKYPALQSVDLSSSAAIFWKDKVMLNLAHSIHNEQDGTEKAVLHEVIGHYGLRNFIKEQAGENFEQEFEKLLRSVVSQQWGTAEFESLANDYFDKTFSELTADQMLEIAEEWIAHKAQTGVKDTWIDRVVSLLRRALRKAGIDLKLSSSEIYNLIGNSYRYVMGADGNSARRSEIQPDFEFATVRHSRESGMASKKQIETPEFKAWFGDSKVVDASGEPIVLYHQTHKDNKNSIFNDGFDLSKKGARDSDEGMPDGVFLKPTNEDIGVGGIKENELQIPVFASIKNPLVVKTREQLMQKYMDDTQYVSIIQDIKNFDKENSKLFDEEWNKNSNFSEKESEESDKRLDQILKVWKKGIREKATKAREILTELINNDGYDGLIVESDQGSFGRSIKTIVALNPNQIKSSEENLGSFDPNKLGIRHMKSNPTPMTRYNVEDDAKTNKVRTLTNLSVNKEAWLKLQENLQDNMVRAKKLIEQKLGRTVKDSSNFYVKENLAKGRTLEQTERFKKDYFKPLLKLGRQMTAKFDVDVDQIGDYLYALHAEERNKYIKSQNPKAPENPSGMSKDEADKIIKNFESKVSEPYRKELVRMVQAINQFVNDKRLATGLISQEVYDTLQDQYENYVPLRGFEGFIDEDTTLYSPLISAKGRESKAENPIPYLVTAAQEAIMKGEANMVKQSLFEFVKENPDKEQYQIRNAWYKKTGEKDEIGEDIWEESAERPTKEQLENEEASRSFNPDIQKAVKMSNRGDNVISLQINGKKVYIEFKRPEIARALKGADQQKVPKLLKWLRSYTRWLSSMYTQYSPEFGVRNFIRDFGFGSFNAIAESGFNDWAYMAKEIPKSSMTLRKYFASDKYKDSKDGKMLKEFIESGGLTGYSVLQNASDIFNAAKAEINRLHAKNLWTKSKSLTKKGVEKLFSPIDVYNRTLENAVRFSYYKALRNSGATPQQAAIKSKDLTVNFNRKGNASSVMGSIYIFFNASVQGSERLLRNFADAKTRKKAVAMFGTLVAAGMAQSMIYALTGDEDDDKEQFYDKVPDYVKRTHIVLPNPFTDDTDDFIKIPLPYGLNVFYSMGEQMGSVIMGKQAPATAATGLLTAASDSFSPIGGFDFEGDELNVYQKISHFAAPSIASPILDLAYNRSFTGAPIRKEPFIEDGPQPPNSQQHFAGVNPIIKGVTDFLNEKTGGDEVMPGTIDINPEDIEHGIQSYFGGPMTFIDKASSTVSALLAGENIMKDPNYRNVPFVRNYLQKAGMEYDARQTFYERLDELEQINSYFKGYVDSSNKSSVQGYYNRNKNKLQLYEASKKYSKAIGKISKAIKAANESGIHNDKVDKLYQERVKLYKAFNKMYNEKTKPKQIESLDELFK